MDESRIKALAVAWLANKLSADGNVLRKGEAVLSGALASAAPSGM